MVTVSVELTKEDFYKYNYFTGWTASWNSKKRHNYYLKCLLYSWAAGFIILFMIETKISLIPAIVAIAANLCFIFLFVPTWIKHNYRKHIDKYFSNPSNSNTFLKTELLIDEKGILSKENTSTTMNSWSAFVNKVETDEYFYLYLNTILAIVIPKIVFKSLTEKKI